MRSIIILFSLLFFTIQSFSQKFMIEGKDTIPYQERIEIRNSDTLFVSTCWTFELRDGLIINQTDDLCLKQGIWIITDSLGNYWYGEYKNNKEIGLWNQFDKTGRLIKVKETLTIARNKYLIKSIDYSSGKKIVIANNPFLGFYLQNLTMIMIVVFVIFFSRIFINSKIYNIENGTNYSAFYFQIGPVKSSNFVHSLYCTFSFWFINYKKENKRLVFLSNSLSVIFIGLFFGLLIGLAFTGNL